MTGDATENNSVVVGLESGNQAVARTQADIDRDILAMGEGDNAATPQGDLQGGVQVPGVEGAAIPPNPERVKRDFKMLVGLGIRLIKGIFAPAWPIPKNDIQELQELWSDYLAEEFPQGVPATKLGFAIMATGALIGEHIDRPRYDTGENGKKVGFSRNLFKAASDK